MPGFVTLPRAPETALTNLGGIVLGGVNDMADRRLARDREERLRAQQLADQERLRAQQLADVDSARQYQRGLVLDERGYQDTQHTRQRGEQMEDEKRRLENDLKVLLRNDGYLAPQDFGNPEAVAAAYGMAQRDGKIARYKELIDAGVATVSNVLGDDQGSLAAARQDLGNKRAAIVAREQQSIMDADEQAAELRIEDARLSKVDAEIGARAAALDRQLNQPQRQISDAEVKALATRQAQAALQKGETLSDDKIAAQLQAARENLERNAYIAWTQDRQDGLVQRAIIADERKAVGAQRGDIRAQLNTLATQFRAVGRPRTPAAGLVVPEIAPAPPPAPTAGPRVSRQEAEAAASAALVGQPKGAPGQPTPAGAGSTVAPPTASRPSRANPSPYSLLGLADTSGVNASTFAAAPANIAAVPGRVLDTASRFLGAGMEGALSGDFTVQPKGPLEMTGERLGGLLGGDPFDPYIGDQTIGVSQRQAEDRVLAEAPNSPMAYEIRRRRARADQEATRRSRALAVPVNTPTQFIPQAALRGQLLEPALGN